MTVATAGFGVFAPAGEWTSAADLPADGAPSPAGVATFLQRETDLLEDWRLDEWLSLFTDDAIYWVPIVYRGASPQQSVNLIFDSRELLGDRVARLQTGEVPSQDPPSRTLRMLSNLTLADAGADGELLARTAFSLVEHRPRAQNTYFGRYLHRLRRTDDGFRIAGKKVELMNSDDSLPSLTFLL